MERDYNKEFQQLVLDALKDGWSPIWIDAVEGNDVFLTEKDKPSDWFIFEKYEK